MPLTECAKSQKYRNVCFCTSSSKAVSERFFGRAAGSNPPLTFCALHAATLKQSAAEKIMFPKRFMHLKVLKVQNVQKVQKVWMCKNSGGLQNKFYLDFIEHFE